jgi:uncharacterized protein (AIM24 family)
MNETVFLSVLAIIAFLGVCYAIYVVVQKNSAQKLRGLANHEGFYLLRYKGKKLLWMTIFIGLKNKKVTKKIYPPTYAWETL